MVIESVVFNGEGDEHAVEVERTCPRVNHRLQQGWEAYIFVVFCCHPRSELDTTGSDEARNVLLCIHVPATWQYIASRLWAMAL